MKKLTKTEEKETNGGGILGNDSTSNSGLAGSLGIGNLLTTESSSQDGDESSHTKTSLGNGIGLDTAGIFNNTKS